MAMHGWRECKTKSLTGLKQTHIRCVRPFKIGRESSQVTELVFGIGFFAKNLKRISRNIKLGKDVEVGASPAVGRRPCELLGRPG